MLSSGRNGLPPQRLGQAIAHALTTRRPRVRYTVTPDLLQHLLMSWLPKRWVDRVLARKLGLLPRSPNAAA